MRAPIHLMICTSETPRTGLILSGRLSAGAWGIATATVPALRYTEVVPMFDTHAIARSLTDADLTPEQADAITDAIRQAAERDMAGLATKADLAELRVELAGLEARLIKWMIGIVFAGAGLVIAGLRLIE